jgi:uncharacterized membrane protein YvbJ
MQEPSKFCPACGQQNYIGAACCHWCQARFPASLNEDASIASFYKEKSQYRQEVVVVDFRMSFNSMIIFMIKWAIAAIPAMILLFFIGMILIAILAGMRGARY